jgi:hypothetical protein
MASGRLPVGDGCAVRVGGGSGFRGSGPGPYAENRIEADDVTVFRWVQRFAPLPAGAVKAADRESSVKTSA